MTMGGSSESDWQKSDYSRGINTSAVSDRNPRLIHAGRIRSSEYSSRDLGLTSGRKEGDRDRDRDRDRVLLPHRNLHRNLAGLSGICEDEVGGDPVDPVVRVTEWNDVSLRQWLDNPERSIDAAECLHIFIQIVEIVNLAHSQGIVVNNVRPSCFVMSTFNRISFIESASCSSDSDSMEDDGSNNQTADFKGSSSSLPHNSYRHGNRFGTENSQLEINQTDASHMVSEISCLQSSSVHPIPNSLEVGSNVKQAEEKRHSFPMKQILLLETNWYTSPEELDGGSSSCASDIYRLGVLLFELFCMFSSAEGKSSTMSSLRHRVLPPQLLLKWPKEASFCLWLLHPDPSSRPKMCDLLENEFLNEPRENIEEREVAIELRERIEEQELLLEFLLMIRQRKQEAADNLKDAISFISSDIEEVTRQQSLLWKKGGSCPELGKNSPSSLPLMELVDNEDSSCLASRKRCRPGLQSHNEEGSDYHIHEWLNSEEPENQGSILSKNSRLMKNFKKLESAYFLTRRRLKPIGKSLTHQSPISSDGRGSSVVNERCSINSLPSKDRYSEARQSGWVDSFLEGLCKYLSFSKLEVKAELKQGDLLNSSNLVCSLSFDRDGEFFAAAGVNKKIKVFEYDTILNEDRDIHYPVVELTSRSKLSSICWNSYIKSQIASSNFNGVVQVWDAMRGQVFMEMTEHERRVWSVDFSLADPTMLASGSDDGSVKLWNINQGVSVGTIKTKANICCVQFPTDSGRSLAFGSADHRIYYYDLRNSKMPLYTMVGHNKTVSYIKFIDSTNLVSSSTDNTLKLWDLSMCASRVLDRPVQSFTGHTNVKNFVGLSVSEGYISTGSETNEVFVYHKGFPMPALSFKFSNTDPISGDEVDDNGQFISSLCWRPQSSTLVAANSMGNIKFLEMV
ncbi:Protein SPA1-RELATED 3 [Sarracenia purpurea var. burkii]